MEKGWYEGWWVVEEGGNNMTSPVAGGGSLAQLIMLINAN